MPTITYSETLVTEICYCGINHAIPANLARRATEEGVGVYCPLGHKWFIRETANDRLEKQKAELEKRLELARKTQDRLREQAETTERKLTAQKGQNTKLRKRVANGVCPCCKRSFSKLAAHMATKHPDFTGEIV